jgi:release factor glutamine methyltransferase
LISFVAEKKGAVVTATDIGEAAIAGLQINKGKLHSGITVIRSNLFDEIPAQAFDFIIINPPYYPENPESDSQLAWYCGTNFEFFEKLFSQLRGFVHKDSRIMMVLSEDCNILHISKIAAKNRFTLTEVQRRKFWWEWNYIFEVKGTA